MKHDPRALVEGEARVVEEPSGGGDPAAADIEAAAHKPRWLFFVASLAVTTWQGVDWATKDKHAPPEG